MRLRQKWPVWALGGALLLAAGVVIPALAADPAAAQHVRGRITAVSADSITVKPRTADAQTFTINAATTITLDKAPVTASQLLADKQEATVASTDGKIATRIEARTRRAKAPPPPPAPTPPPAPAPAR